MNGDIGRQGGNLRNCHWPVRALQFGLYGACYSDQVAFFLLSQNLNRVA